MTRQITPNPQETRVIVRLPHGFAPMVEQVVTGAERRATADNFVSLAVPGVPHDRAMEMIATNLRANGGLGDGDYQMEIDQIQMPSMPIVMNDNGFTYSVPGWVAKVARLFRKRPAPRPAPVPAELNPKCYHIHQVGFDLAWRAGFQGRSVVVGVNDTGCGPAAHVPCASNINTVGFADPQFERDNDHHGHGTHVAGIVCGTQKCDQGIWGGAPGAVLKVFKSGVGYFYTSDLMQAIDEAVKAGVQILNNSWGGKYSDFMQETITRALKSGMVIVKATGNEAMLCPDPYKDCIMVTALSEFNQPSTYSNWVDGSFAPTTIAAYGDNILSHLPNEKTGFMSGTSMATPVVTAALAIMAEKYGARGAELSSLLLERCTEPISPPYGCGRLSLFREFSNHGRDQ